MNCVFYGSHSKLTFAHNIAKLIFYFFIARQYPKKCLTSEDAERTYVISCSKSS